MIKKNRIAFFDADALTNQNAIATNSKKKKSYNYQVIIKEL